MNARDRYTLAYMAAFTAIGIAPGERMAQELAELTHTPADCLQAVRAMVGARELMRVWAALDYLRGLQP